MHTASVAVATDLSAHFQGTPSPIPEPERSRPKALLFACLTIAIERFAFYEVFSLYTLFLVQQYHLTDAQATTQYGVFLGAVYFTPFFGGAISDRFGAWRSISLGILLLTTAYLGFSAGLPLFICVTLLAAGMGLFKGNLTALVGSLFDSHTERDAAYSRFYWSVNLGSLPAGFVGSWLSAHYGYSAAFGSCAAATVVCLLVFWQARSLFPDRARTKANLQHHHTTEQDRVATIITLLPVAALFFCAFHQGGSSLTLFARDCTRQTLAGVPLSPPAYQSIHSALVLGLTPLLNVAFRRWPASTPVKLFVGMSLCSLSFLVMADASMSATFASSRGHVSPLWLLASYTLLSVAELCVAPMGFSLVSQLAPSRYSGLLMGLWLAAIAVGNLSAGLLGRLWEQWSHAEFFGLLAVTSALAIPILWSQRNRLRRVLGGKGGPS